MEVEGEEEDHSSDSLAMKYMMRKYASSMTGADGEDAPLTTKAIRDFEKIQREIVYSRTLVKIRSLSPVSVSVSLLTSLPLPLCLCLSLDLSLSPSLSLRFPDHVCLEGCFHPQDTVQDIRRWLSESCFLSAESHGAALLPFELYMTPPRVVLPLDTTLQDLKLVPAAVLYLSWTAPPSPSPSALGPVIPGENYLNRTFARRVHSLFSRAEEDGLDEGDEEQRADPLPRANQFPRGNTLGGKGESSKQEAGAGESEAKRGGADSESKERKPSAKKPKWLKT
jgi:hypothetical protein